MFTGNTLGIAEPDDLAPPCPPGGGIPSLELRTAYTNKGLSLGIGTLAGVLMFGPWGGLIGTFIGWKIGNAIAISAERKAAAPCAVR